MCGICGWTGQEFPGLMDNMLNRIRHRGPDDEGCYHDHRFHMGMVRLSIIDLKGGHQPISNEKETVWVVFNGEIYNYIELREELEKRGHRFRTQSDTETILHAYEEYGQDFPHHLNGMFAISLWDVHSEKLFLIRDRLGVKPLFYAFAGKDVIFGSEIKAVLGHPLVGKEEDRKALSFYLSLRNIPAPFTAYRQVRALLPGEMLMWSTKGSELLKWYQLPMATRWKDEDEETLTDQIDEILRESIKIRMRSDVDFGAYLSGGIDSSTVVAVMSEFCPKPVKTFTLTFADRPEHKQDAWYARMVSERYGTEHYENVMSWSDLQNEWIDVLKHMDQPFAGVTSSYWLSRFMRRTVKVALSGDGADDFFASYGHHRLVWPISAMRQAWCEGQEVKDSDLGAFQGKKEFVASLATLPPWEWRLAYAAFLDHEKKMLLTPKGRGYFGEGSTADFLKDIYNQSRVTEDDLNRMLYLDIHTLLPNEILYYGDLLSMAHALEVRMPFLDYRLAELACSIPGSLKIRGLTLKYILRRVAKRYLPQEIIDRPKEGFVLPKNTWLRNGMRPMMERDLSAERLSGQGLFNGDYITSLINRFLQGDDSLTFKLWTLMIFQVWFERHGCSS
jgi:asparagine synthase (glutamine-hydrolysing)